MSFARWGVAYLMNSGSTRGGHWPTVSIPMEWARATRAARFGA